MEELRQACIDGDMTEVRKYMDVVNQLSFPLEELEKALKPLVYWTAKTGQLWVLKELIEKYKCDPHYTTERGHTLLYVACARGHANVARYLAHKHMVNPNQKNHLLSTPLFATSNNGHLEAMVMLIDELKCNPKEVNSKGESLLHRACGGGHLEVVKCLTTKYGLNPEARSIFGDTPLHDACGNGHLVIVQYLIETLRCNAAKLLNNSLSTPLHIACRNGHAAVVCYLIEKQNCDLALYDTSGNTAFHLACRYQRREVVKYLLESGKVDPNISTQAGEMPMNITRDPDIIKYLVRGGAKPIDGAQLILQQFMQQAPLDTLVRIIVVGHSGVGKSTLIQALQMPVGYSLGGLLIRANTIASNIPHTAGIVPIEFNSQDFGRVLIYDCSGYQGFHASHGTLIEHSITSSSAPLFLLVINLNEDYDAAKR